MRYLLVLGALSSLVLVAVGCESVEQAPASVPASMVAATSDVLVTPSAAASPPPSAGATEIPTTMPVASAPPRPVATAAPSPSPSLGPTAAAWRTLHPGLSTTSGGAGIAVDGDGRVHLVTSNLEDAWPAFYYDDASVHTSTRRGGRTLGRSVLLGGTSPHVAAAGTDVWIAYHAYACGALRYADVGGIGVNHSLDGGRTWRGPRCLTWGRNAAWPFNAGSPRDVAAAKGVVYVVGAERVRDLTVWISRDGGSTWYRTLLVRKPRTGWGGQVLVAAAGDRAAIAWESRGKVKARTTTDAGRTWSRTRVLPLARLAGADGRGTRIAFWGGDPGATLLTTWTSKGGWSTQQLPDITGAGAEPDGEELSRSLLVALGPKRQLVLLGSGAGCTYDDEDETVTGTSVWAVSQDNGRIWSESVAVEGCPGYSGSKLVIGDDDRPYVLRDSDDWGYELVVGPRTLDASDPPG